VPIRYIVETMRPLAIQALASCPTAIRGLAIIRGLPTPVVDVANLLGLNPDGTPSGEGRFVTLRLGPRQVALAVDAVVGLRTLPPSTIEALPPLLGDAAQGAVDSIGLLDAELVMVLRAGRLVPDEVWQELEARASP